MKIAYISGPYSASLPVKLYNIWLARSYAKKYWKLGYAVICPHSNSALFDKVLPHDTFIRADKALVRASDLIVLIGDWVSSKGAVDELWEAVIYGKHCIFESLQDRGKTFVQRILKLAWGDSHDFHSCLVCKPGTKADDLDSVGEGRVLYSIHHGVLQETPSFEECGRAEADGREAEEEQRTKEGEERC